MTRTMPKTCAVSSGRRSALAAVTLLLAATVALGGCHRPSPPVGLDNCYPGLPLAVAALNAPKGTYKFSGLQLVRPGHLTKLVHHRFPHSKAASHNPPPVGTQVCAFAFTGTFPAGQVADAPSGVSGKAAIVLVTTHRQLLFSFVLARLPIRFSNLA